MIRWAVSLASAVVIVFSATFVATRWTAASDPPQRPRLAAPSAPPAALLRVRTLDQAAKLPPLRRLPAASPSPAPVGTPSPAPPTPPPPTAQTPAPATTASALRAPAASSPGDGTRQRSPTPKRTPYSASVVDVP